MRALQRLFGLRGGGIGTGGGAAAAAPSAAAVARHAVGGAGGVLAVHHAFAHGAPSCALLRGWFRSLPCGAISADLDPSCPHPELSR